MYNLIRSVFFFLLYVRSLYTSVRTPIKSYEQSRYKRPGARAIKVTTKRRRRTQPNHVCVCVCVCSRISLERTGRIGTQAPVSCYYVFVHETGGVWPLLLLSLSRAGKLVVVAGSFSTRFVTFHERVPMPSRVFHRPSTVRRDGKRSIRV